MLASSFHLNQHIKGNAMIYQSENSWVVNHTNLLPNVAGVNEGNHMQYFGVLVVVWLHSDRVGQKNACSNIPNIICSRGT